MAASFDPNETVPAPWAPRTDTTTPSPPGSGPGDLTPAPWGKSPATAGAPDESGVRYLPPLRTPGGAAAPLSEMDTQRAEQEQFWRNATFGLMDPLTAGAAAVGSSLGLRAPPPGTQDQSFGGYYTAERQGQRQRSSEFAAERPGLATTLGIAGAAVPTIATGALAPGLAAGGLLRQAATGAAIGGLSGAGTAGVESAAPDWSGRAADMLRGGELGAAGGAAGPVAGTVLGTIGRALPTKDFWTGVAKAVPYGVAMHVLPPHLLDLAERWLPLLGVQHAIPNPFPNLARALQNAYAPGIGGAYGVAAGAGAGSAAGNLPYSMPPY